MNKFKAFISKYWKEVIIIILFFICIVLIMSTTCSRRDLNKAETNIKALTDTIHTYKLKNGTLLYEKQGFIAEKKELEQYIDIKEKEIKEIEKKLNSSLATIAKLKAQVRVDTIHTIDSVYITTDSIYHNNFKYDDRWLSLEGTNTFRLDPFKIHTTINNISLEVPLKIGTTKDDRWFVTSDNPYVQFTNIEGANIEKSRPKRWSISIQGGLGLVGGVGLVGTQFNNISTSNTGAGWFVGAGGFFGLGVAYKLIEF